MIKNILVGFNGQRGALVAFQFAAELARTAQARLHLAWVEPLAAQAQIPSPADLSADAIQVRLPDTSELPPQDPSTPPDVFGEIAERCREESIHCTYNHLFGDPAERLSQAARLADLVAIGRHDDGRPQAPLGRVARGVVNRMPAPLLLAAHEHREIRGITLLYDPLPASGRALAVAAEIAHLGNITLNIVAGGHGAVEPSEALEEARGALRAYHVEGESLLLTGGADLERTMTTWQDPLLVMAAPAKGWLARPLDAIRPVLSHPATHVLLVP